MPLKDTDLSEKEVYPYRNAGKRQIGAKTVLTLHAQMHAERRMINNVPI